MSRLLFASLSTLALSTSLLFSGQLPFIGQFAQPVVAQTPAAKQAIQLRLTQFKKVADGTGHKLVAATAAKPGDTIVYNIVASNVSDRAVRKLRIDQKIRPGTVYVAQSATRTAGAELSFSIDGGKSYTAQPLINKKPAPASAYTNVRWFFAGNVAPKSKSNVSYAVQVR
jgi:uncharacterized repeat protein (TIGR01451 family)